MPMYDFKCQQCGYVEEHRIDDSFDFNISDVKCSQCGGEVKQQFPTSTSFRLKGKGWAKDRYDKNKKSTSVNPPTKIKKYKNSSTLVDNNIV